MGVSKPLRIFVSYSHRDEPGKERLLAHLKLLVRQGLIAPWDDRQIMATEEWEPALEQHLEDANLIILLISADFLASEYCWTVEMQRAMQRHYAGEAQVLPVFFQPCDWKGAPFDKLQGVPWDAKPIADLANPEDGWTQVARAVREIVEGAWGRAPIAGPAVVTPTRIHRQEHFPRAPAQLFGRDEYLNLLNRAWVDPAVHIVSIVAWGGVGKSALAARWLANLAAEDHRGAESVFLWSFYSQGARTAGSGPQAASADTFIQEALTFFGDLDPSQGLPHVRGERLAGLVAKQRAILVLDGLEPLQFPPGSAGRDGRLKDPALQALLDGLARRSCGLCVLTTREPVTDLEGFSRGTVRERKLEHLPQEAGVELLRRWGVDGAECELRKACFEVQGHALALELLARFLAVAHDGDVRKRDLVGFEEADREIQGGHAFRTIGAYQRWLLQNGKSGERQVAVLHLLGLFDRPADSSCLSALRSEPVIPHLTEPLVQLTTPQWNTTIKRLEQTGLVSSHRSHPSRRSHLDAHPLVREYFGQRLRREYPDAWRAAHRRLYGHLTGSTECQPTTLNDMRPLCQAVAHGCHAGRQQEALGQVYKARILRLGGEESEERFLTQRLGGFSDGLCVVSCFFDEPWSKPTTGLPPTDRGWVAYEATWCLRAVTRLSEAVTPGRFAFRSAVDSADHREAAKRANTLADLLMRLGELTEAKDVILQGVEQAKRAELPRWRGANHALLGGVLHHLGELDAASQHLGWAEDFLQGDYRLARWVLHRLADLLLDTRPPLSAIRDVENRFSAALTQSFAADHKKVRGIAHLGLARLALARYAQVGKLKPTEEEMHHFRQAVDDLKASGRRELLPEALLTRAKMHGLLEDSSERDRARTDLDEAWRIAEPASMRLFMVDILLARLGIFLRADPYPWVGVEEDLTHARALITEHKYRLREGTLADLERKRR